MLNTISVFVFNVINDKLLLTYKDELFSVVFKDITLTHKVPETSRNKDENL